MRNASKIISSYLKNFSIKKMCEKFYVFRDIHTKFRENHIILRISCVKQFMNQSTIFVIS